MAQYCTLDVASAIAEMVRFEDLREIEEAQELRVHIWELRFDESAIADYSTPERAAGNGFAWESLTSDAWQDCRSEALRVMDSGGRGLLAPSAALPQGITLTLFGPRTEIAWSAEPSLSIQIPARRIVRGSPGDHLVRYVRFFGEGYPDVEAPVPDRLFDVELISERP